LSHGDYTEMVSDAKIAEEAANLARQYQSKYRGCSQSVLKAVQDCLDLGDGSSWKAATVFSGGINLRGETCGALLGGIMAVGLALGRERLEEALNSRAYMEAHYYAGELWDRFKAELRNTKCRDILKVALGRRVDLREKEALRRLIIEGGFEHCPEVCSKAARLAAEVILQARAAKNR
jgi:C_GCAxxG_C_C family probable redox protein